MSSGYLVPARAHRVEMTVVNSRFITTVAPAPTVEAAKEVLASVRAEMPDANHHVYAYRVGYGNSIIEGMSDDGEPSGTSDPPVLAVIRGSALGDIIIVVTRYFGGTKLGTGGLVRAYTESAQYGLEALPTTRKIERKLVGTDLPYHFYQPTKRLIEQHEGEVDEETFGADVTLLVLFPVDRVAPFISAMIELTNGAVEPVVLSD